MKRQIYLTQKGEDAYHEAHTFYKYSVGQYGTITTNSRELAVGQNLISVYKDYSL